MIGASDSGAVFHQRDVSSVFRQTAMQSHHGVLSPSVQSLSSPRVGPKRVQLSTSVTAYNKVMCGDSDVDAYHKFFKFISLQ